MTAFLNAAQAADLDGKPGKQAVKAEYRGQVNVRGNGSVTGSVDLDDHHKTAERKEIRWDYGVGFNVGSDFALWIEPHPASGSGKVEVVRKNLVG